MLGPEGALFLLALAASPDLDDAALAARIRAGDHDAFRHFFDRHYAGLYHFLRRRGVADSVAEDLVQNAFVYVWEHRAEIDPGKSLRAYLFRIGYTRLLNHVRDTARFDGEPEAEHTPSEAAGPAERTQHAEMHARLLAAVATLPERRRAVFELCFLQELTHREAAEALGISPKTVEHQMGHALKAIRQAMQIYRQP